MWHVVFVFYCLLSQSFKNFLSQILNDEAIVEDIEQLLIVAAKYV